MINSRDVNDLRFDIAAYCRALLAACNAIGYNAQLACTYRDQEYQAHLHETIGAPVLVSFHGVGLAFDVFLNVNGRAVYNNVDFWDFISKVGKAMGFTWGGDWTTVIDKPHFQWDGRGKYTGAMVRSGNLPPLMKTNNVDTATALKLGSTGQEVRQLQARLSAVGFPCVVDGDFGVKTEKAVRDFQASHGLTVDGIVGAQTLAALNEDATK